MARKASVMFASVCEAVRDHIEEHHPDSGVTVSAADSGTVIRVEKAFSPSSMRSGAIILGRRYREVDPDAVEGIRRFKVLSLARDYEEDDLADVCIKFAESVVYDQRTVENAVVRNHRRGHRLDPVPNVGRYVATDHQSSIA